MKNSESKSYGDTLSWPPETYDSRNLWARCSASLLVVMDARQSPAKTDEYDWFIKVLVTYKETRKESGNHTCLQWKRASQFTGLRIAAMCQHKCKADQDVHGSLSCSIISKFLLNHREWVRNADSDARLHWRKRIFKNELNVARKRETPLIVKVEEKTGLLC